MEEVDVNNLDFETALQLSRLPFRKGWVSPDGSDPATNVIPLERTKPQRLCTSGVLAYSSDAGSDYMEAPFLLNSNTKEACSLPYMSNSLHLLLS